MFFILGLFLSTALYGILSLGICIFGLKINLPSMLNVAMNPGSMLEIFYAYMIWSVPAYIVLLVVHFLLYKINLLYSPRYRSEFNLETLFSWIIADLTNPIRGLRSLIVGRKYNGSKGLWGIYVWGQVILHFVWTIVLILWLINGFAQVL